MFAHPGGRSSVTESGNQKDKPGRTGRRQRWLPWRRDNERHLSGLAVSAIIHVALLLLLASVTFSPGEGLFGRSSPGLDEASLSLGQERHSDVEARELLKQISVDPLKVQQRQRRAPTLPKLRSLGAPPVSSSERIKGVSARFSVPGGEFSGDFGSLIGRLRKRGLDVVIVVDSTVSMQQVIDDLTERMNGMVASLQRLVPTARIGAVAYRDHGDVYVTRWSDLTFHGHKITAFLSQLRAEGGGDWEEAVLDALDTAISDLSWRKQSKKVIILVGGSPPHPEDMSAILELVQRFSRDDGFVSTIDITQRLHEAHVTFMHKSIHGKVPTEFPPLPEHFREVSRTYGKIAKAGGGEMAGDGWDGEIAEQVLVFAFGSRWRSEVLGARTSARN